MRYAFGLNSNRALSTMHHDLIFPKWRWMMQPMRWDEERWSWNSAAIMHINGENLIKFTWNHACMSWKFLVVSTRNFHFLSLSYCLPFLTWQQRRKTLDFIYTKKYEPIFVLTSLESSNFPNKYQFSSILSTVIRHLQLDEWIDSMIQYQLNKSMGFRYMHQQLHSTPMLLSSFHYDFRMKTAQSMKLGYIWINSEWNYRFSAEQFNIMKI